MIAGRGHPKIIAPGCYRGDAGHAADVARYRARGCAMKGNRIRIVKDRPQSAVEIHGPSARSVNMSGVTVEYYPPRPATG